MGTEVHHVSVAQMIDLAIGTPECGIVDFNMLQSVLHVLAQQQRLLHKSVELRGLSTSSSSLNMQTITVTEFKLPPDGQGNPEPIKSDMKAAQDTMLVVERQKRRQEEADDEAAAAAKVHFVKDTTKMGTESKAGFRESSTEPEFGGAITAARFIKLERTVERLNNRARGSVSNEQLIEDIRAHPGSKSITDMWATMNMSSRVETLEMGLEKLSSLVQDLAAGTGVAVPSFVAAPEGSTSSGAADTHSVGAADTHSVGSASGGALAPHQLRADIDRLFEALNSMGIAAGAGLHAEMEGETQERTRHKRETLSGGPGVVAGAGAAAANQAALKEVKDKVDKLEKRLKQCCDKMNKVGGVVNDQLNSFQDQLVGLGEDVASVNDTLASGQWSPELIKDVRGLSEVMVLVQELQDDVRSVRKMAATLAQEKEERAHNLNALMEQVELLKTLKLDREDLAEAMAEKADARLLARKVSHDQFELACDDLSRGLDNAFTKLNTQESLWQQALDDIQREIENKLDKLEMAPVKQFFMDKLKQLQENLRQMAALRKEAEAAGTKKKFLRDVNCISCDARAIMNMEEGPSIPVPKALPPHMSMKPYLTYELDQLRKQQAAGAMTQRNMHDWETIETQSKLKVPARSKAGKHLCTRYCGGSHTMTTPAQRVSRVGHFLRQWGPDVMPLPPTKDHEMAKEGGDNGDGGGRKGECKKEILTDCRCLEDGAKILI